MNPKPLPTLYRVHYNPVGPPNKRWVVWKSASYSQHSWSAASVHRTRAAAEKALAKVSSS